MFQLREKFQWILENFCRTCTFQLASTDPATEQTDAGHLCACAGLGILHRITDEHGPLCGHVRPTQGDLDDVGLGLGGVDVA